MGDSLFTGNGLVIKPKVISGTERSSLCWSSWLNISHIWQFSKIMLISISIPETSFFLVVSVLLYQSNHKHQDDDNDETGSATNNNVEVPIETILITRLNNKLKILYSSVR